jgi:hypothetical protein
VTNLEQRRALAIQEYLNLADDLCKMVDEFNSLARFNLSVEDTKAVDDINKAVSEQMEKPAGVVDTSVQKDDEALIDQLVATNERLRESVAEASRLMNEILKRKRSQT